MDIKDIGYKGVDWPHLAQDRVHWRALVNMAVSLRIS
jgi:hypothetical protein